MTCKYHSILEEKYRKEGRKKDDSEVVTSVDYVLLHFRVGPSLYVIPQWAIRELKGP